MRYINLRFTYLLTYLQASSTSTTVFNLFQHGAVNLPSGSAELNEEL